MVNLRQEDLDNWQHKNFPKHCTSEVCALGMAEEVGELCHFILKRSQKIREGKGSDCKEEIADAFADIVIFGIQLMSVEGLDAENILTETIDKVLKRDWGESDV